MPGDFNLPVDRWESNSVKWDLFPKFLKPGMADIGDKKTILPMWIADMDFQIPRPVIDALAERAAHGVFGYADRTESYDAAVVQWMESRHGWDIRPEMICPVIGVVPALHLIVREFTRPGDKIIIQPPVYPPFFEIVTANDRRLALNPLIYEHGAYRMDFDALERQAKAPDVKLAILCSPHNPVGRVWTREELARFGKICLANDVLVAADEIHGDLVLEGHRFVPFASLDDAFADRSITCTAPTKTFNIASLMVANTLISNREYRKRFVRMARSAGWFGINAFGLTACETAYRCGDPWLSRVLSVIGANFDYLYAFLAREIPGIIPTRAQGTYLAWLDCNGLSVAPDALDRFMLEKAGLFLNSGPTFGPGGEGFVRMNLGCPRATVEAALDRLKQAVSGLPR